MRQRRIRLWYGYTHHRCIYICDLRSKHPVCVSLGFVPFPLRRPQIVREPFFSVNYSSFRCIRIGYSFRRPKSDVFWAAMCIFPDGDMPIFKFKFKNSLPYNESNEWHARYDVIESCAHLAKFMTHMNTNEKTLHTGMHLGV